MDVSSADTASTKLLSFTQRSASEDLGCRRGEFSRKHYGSVELLISSDADGAIQRAGRFRVENGSSDENADYAPGTWHRTDVHLENPEYHTRWYFKYFLGKVHQNYVGTDTEKNPFFLSVVLSDQNNQRVPQYRAILWKKTGTQKICLPYSPTKTLSVKSILSAMNLDKFEKGPREIFTPEIQKGSVNFKFGVLYAKDGQLTDDEMFSNETGSECFQKFLNLMGETITLKGWIGYRGGLDTKNDTTGIHSIYTVYQGHEIMFHVSTMLPYSKENKQQVERKRHIGNDIVTIVFQEGEDLSSSFKPSMIRSHFTHIFALVRYNKQNDSYRLKIFSEESVPLFGPPLPSPPVFTDHHEFRDFVLVKLINGEKATLETPTFSQKRQRTLDMLIRSLYQDLIPDLHKNMLNRRSFSDVLPESPKSARKKEEARQAEFVRVGQALKLKTIVRGDAPTSLVTTGLYRKELKLGKLSTEKVALDAAGSHSEVTAMGRKDHRTGGDRVTEVTATERKGSQAVARNGKQRNKPWEPQCFCNNFPLEIICSDSWGQSLLISTEAGVLLLDEGQSPVPVFDRTLPVKQMDILETQDLFLCRADKGKDARLFVFRLSTIKKALEEKQLVKSKADCKDNKLEKTKGCHLYATNTHHSSELRIVVAIRNKLLLITRKSLHRSNSFPSFQPCAESPVEEFQYIREICLSDPPVVMTLVDGPTGENDNLICVAYRHQFDLVNESTGETYRLHHVDASKVSFVAAIDVYEDGEAGLLLCYNYVCYYKKVCPFNGGSPLMQPSASDFHFSWNQVPNSIVCAFPYILAFTTDSIEIRLVVNGNLVHTAVMLELHLTASQSDIYFTSAAASMNAASCGSSKEASLQSSPQTPTGQELPALPSSQGEAEAGQAKHGGSRIGRCRESQRSDGHGAKGSSHRRRQGHRGDRNGTEGVTGRGQKRKTTEQGEIQWKHIYKIPLSNLVGRSIERPLKSPLVAKVATTPTSSVTAPMPVTHSLSLSRMEIKEIACRTRKELLGLTTDSTTTKSDGAPKQKKWSRKGTDEQPRRGAVRSTSSDRILAEVMDTESEAQRHLSTSSDPDTTAAKIESPLPSCLFHLNASFDDEVLDLK